MLPDGSIRIPGAAKIHPIRIITEAQCHFSSSETAESCDPLRYLVQMQYSLCCLAESTKCCAFHSNAQDDKDDFRSDISTGWVVNVIISISCDPVREATA